MKRSGARSRRCCRSRAAFESFKRGGPCSLLGAPAEVEVLHAGGRLVPAELAVALPPNGKVDGASVFVRDITPRREAEAREQQRQQRLDEAREGLARAQKLEAVGKLTGGVAHDFNNILHIISANVQLMLRAEGPMNKKRLHSILDAVDRGAKLAGQLLAFARRQPLHPTVVDVSQLRERHALTGGHTFQAPEDSFAEPESAGWRHSVFERLDVVYVHHLGFVVTGVTHALLFDEPVVLVYRIVQLAERFTHFAPTEYQVELLGQVRVARL